MLQMRYQWPIGCIYNKRYSFFSIFQYFRFYPLVVFSKYECPLHVYSTPWYTVSLSVHILYGYLYMHWLVCFCTYTGLSAFVHTLACLLLYIHWLVFFCTYTGLSSFVHTLACLLLYIHWLVFFCTYTGLSSFVHTLDCLLLYTHWLVFFCTYTGLSFIAHYVWILGDDFRFFAAHFL